MKEIIRANSDNGIIDFEPVFACLNKELLQHNQSLKLVCAGGYVMQLHGCRATVDVDAFYQTNREIDGIIRTVGDEFGINNVDELWLNNSISNMNPQPSDNYCELKYIFSNLEVKVVSLTYLIGMKLSSERVKDVKDVATILKQVIDTQPIELASKLDGMNFEFDISILLDAYGQAYGMKWLEEFYEAHQSEIDKYY